MHLRNLEFPWNVGPKTAYFRLFLLRHRDLIANICTLTAADFQHDIVINNFINAMPPLNWERSFMKGTKH